MSEEPLGAAVQVEEHQGGEHSGALVAVDEGMVLQDVKKVRSGHGEKVFVDDHAIEGRLRLRKRRLEQPAIAHADSATIAGELERVQLEHVLDVEEPGRVGCHFASFLSVSSCASIIRSAADLSRAVRSLR